MQTRTVFIWERLLITPFWAMYCLLPFILYRELDANAWEVTLIIALKPLASLLSPYWSGWVHNRRDRLVSNLVFANILRFVPFLLLPWMGTLWWCIISYGLFMMLSRGIIPAWMEVIRCTVPKTEREQVFQTGNTIYFLGPILLPLFCGGILDRYPDSWRWLYFATASVGSLATFVLLALRLPQGSVVAPSPVKNFLQKPWQDMWSLLKERPDFTAFQVGFMLGGTGLMIIHPALPAFFTDSLGLSYTGIMSAISLSKGVGFAVASPLAVRWFRRMNIFYYCSLITSTAALFPLFLFLATSSNLWLFFGYFLYGVMQSGSELSWNLSGPSFSREQDSSVFSTTNVLMVGIRGCAAPWLGTILFQQYGAFSVLLTSGLCCLFGTFWMAYRGRQQASPLLS